MPRSSVQGRHHFPHFPIPFSLASITSACTDLCVYVFLHVCVRECICVCMCCSIYDRGHVRFPISMLTKSVRCTAKQADYSTAMRSNIAQICPSKPIILCLNTGIVTDSRLHVDATVLADSCVIIDAPRRWILLEAWTRMHCYSLRE
jgi:hypothetical protein